MKSLTKMGIMLSLFFTFSLAAHAEYYERDNNYIYRVQPYKEVFSTNEGIKLTAEMAHMALINVLESMKKANLIPDAIVDLKDLEQLKRSQKDVDRLVDYLNEFITDQRARGGRLEALDVVPNAFMVFGGRKMSLAMGGGIGGSLQVGMIVMPVKVERIEIKTGKPVDEVISIRAAVIGWPSGDVGMGIGGGPRMRFGLGAIWDMTDSFSDPKQFWGAGLGASWSPVTVIGGLNAKVGFLSNTELSGWLDFTYATVAFEYGPSIELGTPRVNFTTMFAGAELMKLLGSSQEEAYNQILKDLDRKMDQFLKNKAQEESLQEGAIKQP